MNQSSYDITIDYANDTKDDEDVEMGSLKVVNVFSDKKAAGRPVTSINWSHKYPELMAASYAGQVKLHYSNIPTGVHNDADCEMLIVSLCVSYRMTL